MPTLFFILAIIALVCLILGLIKPSKVKLSSRKKVLVWFGGSFIVLLILVGATTPTSPEVLQAIETANQEKAKQNQTNNTKIAEQKANSVPTEYKSALKQATSYADMMHMSKKGLYDQLVSEYGEKFTAEAAQYAIDNVKVDWNANALAKAKEYQTTMNQSPAAIRDQLVSEYGEKFTAAEADYAIQHLND